MTRLSPARVRALVLAVVLLAGILFLLPLPFSGDQALFSLGGQGMRHDVGYYSDFWDVKQPGIYWLYGALGAIHDGPFVVHLFNIGWCLGLSVLLQRGTRSWFTHAWVSAVSPLFVVLPYLLTAGSDGATQIETFVPLLVVGCVLLGAGAAQSARMQPLVLAGLVAGVGGVFKLILLPTLLLAALGPVVFDSAARRRTGWWRGLVVCIVASALPLLAAVIALLAGGANAGLLWRTTFTYPSEISRLPGMHSAALIRGYLKQGIEVLAAPAALAVVAFLPTTKKSRRTSHGAVVMTLALVTLLALVLTLPQRLSPYQIYALLGSVGLLGVFGLDRLFDLELTQVRRGKLSVAAVAVIVVAPLAYKTAHNLSPLVHNKGALTAASRESYRRDIASDYDTVKLQVQSARAGGVPAVKGSFYAMANPLYYSAVGADRQALQHNGWSPEQMTDRQWREWTRELVTNRPSALVIDGFSQPYISQHAPQALAFLQSHYQRIFQGRADDPDQAVSWWTTADPGTPAPHAGAIQL